MASGPERRGPPKDQGGQHTGEIELRNGDIGGIVVHIAARLAELSGPGEVTKSLAKIESGGRIGPGPRVHLDGRQGSDGWTEVRRALPTGESLLIQSLVQVFAHEFGRHIGGSCPLPRDLTFQKIIDRDHAAGRFLYDRTYASKQADWTYAT